jgi:putative ABC transport system permease protein
VTPLSGPPRLARLLADRLTHAAQREFLLGDLEEQYTRLASRSGRGRANLAYWRQVAGLLRHRTRRRSTAADSRRGDSTLRTFMHDLRYGARVLARQPMYVLVAVLSLSLAIAANGIVFGMVDSIVLQPFSLPDPQRLISVGSTFPKLDGEEGFIEQHSTVEIEDLRAAQSLVSVAAFDLGNRAISNGTTAMRALTALVVDDPQPALGFPAKIGRGFTKAELSPGGPPAVILSHRLWMSLFGGDAGIVGRTVRVNSVPREVIGVADERARLLGTDLWIPWGGNPIAEPRNQRQFTVIARLAPHASIDDANAELAAIAGRTIAIHQRQFPEYEGWRLRAVPWAEAVTGQARGPANILLIAGLAVMLIASANLVNLMLVRLSARRREIAVRYALGAGRWQVTRLMLIESALIAFAACAAGLALAAMALGPMTALLPVQVISLGVAPSINLRVVLYCAAFAATSALLVALVPAWQSRRAAPQASLRDGAGGAGSRQRLRQALVVVELTLAIVLLVGAGQMLASFARLQRTDPGFDMKRIATMRLTLAWERYGQNDAATTFFETLVDRIAALPDVTAAAAATQYPPQEVFTQTFRVVSDTASGGAPTLSTANATIVTPGYFDVLGLKATRGRLLTRDDRAGAPMAVVVNESFARRFLDGKPEGRLRIGPSDRSIAAEIVGVVGDARNVSMLKPAQPEMFMTVAQAGGGNQYFLLARTTGEPAAATTSIRQTLAAMDPDQPLYMIQSMEDAVAGSLFAQRVSLLLVGVFAVGALAIAGVGVFGIVSYWVATRSKEIGIRMALGATRREVARLIVGQATLLVGIAAVLGLSGGALLARAVGALLYESARVDPAAIAGVAIVLAGVGLAASYLPSRRAVRVDPITVLRME